MTPDVLTKTKEPRQLQLVADGPDIPTELFQKLEDDELVLFCGAGLSMGAGLCDFKTLVKKVIEKNGECSGVTKFYSSAKGATNSGAFLADGRMSARPPRKTWREKFTRKPD
jgi:hypothetical protein